MRRVGIVLSCAAALALLGCDGDSVSERERSERADALFAEAMAAEGRGDAAGAEALYRQLLVQDGGMASAHLNLAILQHDLRKNYIEAIHHYQAYLDLQPDSEKAAMVRGRLDSARALLTTQLAAETVAREQRALASERDTLRMQIRTLEAAANDLRGELSAKDKTVTELTAKVAALQKLVDAMKSAESEEVARLEGELKEARETAEQAKAALPDPSGTDDLIAAVRADAKRMIEEPDGGAQDAVNEATRLAVEGRDDEPPLTATPTSGRRYTVRPGDTLSRLAREAYGNAAEWTRIRNANRSTTNPDGRLRAGETILIP